MPGIEDERAIICGLSVAVDVAGDGRRIGESGDKTLEPIQPDHVEQIVAEVELNLMTPIHRRTTGADAKRIRNSADESIRSIAHAVQRVVERPCVARAHTGRRQQELNLPRHR